MLADRDILAAITDGTVCVDPFDATAIQPASLDIRLDKLFRVFDAHKYQCIDPAIEQPDLTHIVEVADGEALTLHPGDFVLGSTQEVLSLGASIAAQVGGKSSLGRLGIQVHATAGFIDPGFSGHITLELSNIAVLPVKLYPGMLIGQVCFFAMSSPVEHPYGSAQAGSHYQGQRGPTPSRAYMQFRSEMA